MKRWCGRAGGRAKEGDREAGRPRGPDPADHLYFLFALPKSAGQALAAALDRLRPGGRQGAVYPPSLFCPNGLHVELPLTDAVLGDFPAGGWHHYHAPATLVTLDFLSRHRVRHVVAFRHPFDQLVAYYCHLRKHLDLGQPMAAPWQPGLMYANPMAPLRAAAFAPGRPLEDSLSHLIRGGYLEATLDWIGKWLTFRSRTLSAVVTYEGLTARPGETLRRLADHLRPMVGVPADGVGRAVAALAEYPALSRAQDARGTAYPRGYTGEVGVHRRYFSARNRAEARAACTRFAASSACARQVFEAYPDLLAPGD
ncbi:MAG TPA: hypothetical protein VH092_18900 [Urbifossiella sp.]|jgi:hypothetical protein|nr:hypothetical protein [Urbifossiella sp.]